MRKGKAVLLAVPARVGAMGLMARALAEAIVYGRANRCNDGLGLSSGLGRSVQPRSTHHVEPRIRSRLPPRMRAGGHGMLSVKDEIRVDH